MGLFLFGGKLANQPPIGPKAEAVTADAFEVYASVDVDALVTRLANETRRLMTDYAQQGLTGADLADAVDEGLRNLSDTPLGKAGRMAGSEAFNLGRNLAIQDNLDGISVVVRTEVLDDATCDPCRELDGNIFKVNTPEYFENMPPNGCEGRELCRGFYLARAA